LALGYVILTKCRALKYGIEKKKKVKEEEVEGDGVSSLRDTTANGSVDGSIRCC
jgi:hypothetical protein